MPEESSKALAVRGPSTGDMLAAVIQQGITPSSVEVMERLCALREREQAAEAARDFAAAFAALQAETAPVKASKSVPGNDGTIRYRYAPFEEIMRTVRPMLTKHQFSISFDTEFAESRVTAICTLMHGGGHSRASRFACRIGSGPPKASEAQGDGAAVTYAKRFALCAALNIVIEQDSDARILGDNISPEQAKSLQDRCMATKPATDLQKFLKYAGADSFDAIPAGKYSMLDEALRKREANPKPEGSGLNREESKW